MEEILASIRRIIEDSDSGRKQADEEMAAGQQAEPVEESAPAEVDVFRAELHAAPVEAKPVTLADVQEQLSATAGVPAGTQPAARPAVTLAEVGARLAAEQQMEPRNMLDADAITADWRRDIAAAGGQAPDTAKAAAEAVHAGAQPEELAVQDEPSSTEPASEAAQPDLRLAGEAQLRPTLVSEQTSRQVAAAFGELSEAFASRGRKSFDEMAEEMLRPMLQDWLDNNLPTLVERLVREEIERVARGS